MTSTHEHAPMGDSETCAVCEHDILTMSYKGTGVCGQKCLAAWRKEHPIPEALRFTKEELAEALQDTVSASDKSINLVWDVLNGHV